MSRNRPKSPLPAARLALITATVLGASVTHAAANCSAAGINWRSDPVFRATEHPDDRQRPVRTDVVCIVEQESTVTAGNVSLRLTLGKLTYEKADGIVLPVRLVDISKVEPTGLRSIGRILLGEDPLDRQLRFEPQARDIGGTVLIRIAPRHDAIYRLDGEALRPVAADGWQKAARAALPENEREGSALSIDLERMEGRLSIRAGGTDPAVGPLPSAFAPRRVLVAALVWRGGELSVDKTSIVERRANDEVALDGFESAEADSRAALGTLPPGVEPCTISGWSNDVDRKGLNVRAAPDAKAKVVGIVPPPRKMPPEDDAFGSGPVKAEFRIAGYKDGWFLIDDIKAPGTPYDVTYPRSLPQPYKGRGWVNGKMVGAALANGGLPEGRVYAAPHADARSREVLNSEGNRISLDGTKFRLLACSGPWGLIEIEGGHRGWWRGLCSNQVTNCS